MPHPHLTLAALIAAVLLALSGPAAAADWTRYENARFGYAIEVPADFAAQGEAANGDGQIFAAPTAKLTVFGQYLTTGDFEDEVRTRIGYAEDEGWGITYQVSTPHGASYSGKRGSRILYVRMIALCEGTAFGAFELQYSMADLRAFDPLVARLVRGFVPTGAC